MAAYILAAVALNLFVVHRLTVQADSRLSERLVEAEHPTPATAGTTQTTTDTDHDFDDVPRFVWIVSGSGSPIALTDGSPRLPQRTWSTGATTVDVQGTPFRFQAIQSGAGWLVSGESLAQLDRFQSALLLPELILGILLLVVTFVGSLIIGLRASAPLELVHRRQVEFTADASHELRTPLSVIEAEVELALGRTRQPEEYRVVLRQIGEEGRRLRHIIDDLLWLARIDDEQNGVAAVAHADVARIARSSVSRFQSVASARGVLMQFDHAGGGPALVQADPTWIDRLVGVLVDNASKFAGVGGRVDVAVLSEGTRVVLRVDDNGPGIPVAQRPFVLDRFHRGTDHTGGTGLGLAIADSVVRATDGAWVIEEAPSGGARMEVSWRREATSRSREADADRDEEVGASTGLSSTPGDAAASDRQATG